MKSFLTSANFQSDIPLKYIYPGPKLYKSVGSGLIFISPP